MISFFAILLGLFFQAFRSKGIIRTENALLKKENDTMLGKRLYVFTVISHKTREIIQFAITELRPEHLSGSS